MENKYINTLQGGLHFNEQWKKKDLPVFSQGIAAHLLMRGHRLFSIARNHKYNGKTYNKYFEMVGSTVKVTLVTYEYDDGTTSTEITELH